MRKGGRQVSSAELSKALSSCFLWWLVNNLKSCGLLCLDDRQRRLDHHLHLGFVKRLRDFSNATARSDSVVAYIESPLL